MKVMNEENPESLNYLIDEITALYYQFRNFEQQGCMATTLGHHMAVLTDLLFAFGHQFTRLEALHPNYQVFKERIMNDYSKLIQTLSDSDALRSNEVDRKNIVTQLNRQLSVLVVKLNSMKSAT